MTEPGSPTWPPPGPRRPSVSTAAQPAEPTVTGRPERDPSLGVYGISVTADLIGIGVHTLRLYERRGLLEPDRTDGGTRRYSQVDLDRLRRICELVAAGVNLAGVAVILELEEENALLRAAYQQALARAATDGRRDAEPAGSAGPDLSG